VLDEEGRPYSKSQIEEARRAGKKITYISPEDLIAKNGAELLRLWVASTDFRGDIPFSEAVLRGLTDWYRKFRNTSRFVLGNLYDFQPDAHPLDRAALREVDRYALARLGDLVAQVRTAYDAYEFHVVHRSLVDYVAGDLSALYLDVIKDRLYNDPADSASRRAAQSVLYTIGHTLARLTAPILAFTAEDIWEHLPRRAGEPASVHLMELPEGRRLEAGDELAARWAVLLRYRDAATKQLEAFRAEKHRSEDAQVTLRPLRGDRPLLAERTDLLAELFLVSRVDLAAEDAPGDQPGVAVTQAPGRRCDRCWKWYETMAPGSDDLCTRCHGAVAGSGLR
jgi:isoleucyl-tRNA synthetase